MVDVVQGYIRFLKDEARRATKTASHNRLQEIRARKEDLAVAQTERERVPLVEAMILASSGESFADATALVIVRGPRPFHMLQKSVEYSRVLLPRLLHQTSERARALKGASAMRPSQVASDEAP